MRYLALATDYDGTLAHDGAVPEPAIHALEKLRASGRKIILVTGREMTDMFRLLPEPTLQLFDRIVAENGALLYDPAKRQETPLGEAPPPAFVVKLRQRGVSPLSVGRVIVATWTPHEQAVLDTIHELGLELQVVFNKGAVMVLPSGTNKASGLVAALKELGLSPHDVVGVGDAENDHALLSTCECGVAVANALPSVKERADWVTQRDHGCGVEELIHQLLADDLKTIEPSLHRHDLRLGDNLDGKEFALQPYGANVLIAGTSGAGKSTLATMFLEKLTAQKYQYCILDPEGDYDQLEDAVVVGDAEHPPQLEAVMSLLAKPEQNCVVNLVGVRLEDRPAIFDKLMSALLELRTRTARPHWIILDETHHLAPAEWAPGSLGTSDVSGLVMITCFPDHVAPAVLKGVNLILTIGETPAKTVGRFCEILGEPVPPIPDVDLKSGEVIAWWRSPAQHPFWFRADVPQQERRRHIRKYAAGKLDESGSFYFRGPDNKLNLRAYNLLV
ncbi:MAG TPA: HAD-IIB family hydrolase, partial [Candidatus Methylacidiphilales bacterium]|nr:HAD-IIB family hydrolase [Candidatus Methylacidiphilales bacterium]